MVLNLISPFFTFFDFTNRKIWNKTKILMYLEALGIINLVILNAKRVKDIGENYLNELRKFSLESKYICDKMPLNFLNLGMIFMALPNARIIHAVRDPMDCCFSNYCHLYSDQICFSYKQETLGSYYKNYNKLMQHWKNVLPDKFIFEVKYEDLIIDTEKEIRKMNDFIGLDWEPKCIEFYKNNRNVITPSKMQVNKPIYKTSIGKWKRFEKHLKPLYDILNLTEQMI